MLDIAKKNVEKIADFGLQFPFKIAKVVPVFKQGSHMLCTNYCPISVLPAAA